MIKKGILFMSATLLIGMGSCGQKSDESVNQSPNTMNVADNKGVQSEDHGTILLTKADFLAKVVNYEENPQEWKFLGEKPCLIDFYADWCAPCRISSPILEELAKEYEGKINIYKIDTQKEQELAMVFGIQSIPAFLYCPMEGNPTMTAGIAGTPEETKQMFRNRINDILLQ
jgi:thioredoxin